MGTLTWILSAVVVVYFIHLIADLLNRSRLRLRVPEAFQDIITEEDYNRQREYLRDRMTFGMALSLLTVSASVALALSGAFGWLDSTIRVWQLSEFCTSLTYFGVLYLGNTIAMVPFSAYSTFVIEERYGFNRTTARTFFLDLIKQLVLGAVIGGAVVSVVLWLFSAAGPSAWLYCWAVIALLQLLLTYIAPVVIFPLFNTYSPLPDGELRAAIEEYASKVNFPFEDIYVCDASKRSSKGNAFFVGFGKLRRIALYDTLIEELSIEEIVAIFAHEVGHCRRRHVPALSALSTGLLGLQLWIFSSALQMPWLTEAFGFSQHSLHAAIIAFGYLYVPLAAMLSSVSLWLSRVFEFQADAFAAETASADALASALKTLGKQNYAHLSPHPLAVALEQSHPPLKQRIETLYN